ncbi:hypothetical protein FN846DRAFT_979615 [Sphaerosporella brunnea]|uniref:Uncharacterized protein n=1 Tax=Sphaerosporella brunnea TaxID=1250544 RepID=A0A5J5EEB1_9PEZI|nr:hypothetical protein FN846DRAFT_979615 [Sphaerosporella brunnea]
MRDRKASVSATPQFITQGLTQNTVSTPDEIVPPSSAGGLGSYFSLSRQPSSGGTRPLSRRPSLTSSHSPASATLDPNGLPASSSASTFSLKLSHPRTPGAPVKMFSRTNTGTLPPLPVGGAGMASLPPPPTSPNGFYTTLHDTCTKRIATLDYLRRAHEGRVYFFNVMLMPRSDLQKVVYPDIKKLQKKASHFFVLGNSLPSILEVANTTQSALDYLRAFNALLQEYETHISLPPSRQLTTRAHSGSISLGSGASAGGGNSSLRNMSKFFSRSGHVKPRRGSVAANGAGPDLTLERTRSASNSSGSGPGMNISGPTLVSSGGEDTLPPLPVSLPASTLNSVPGEEYIYLTHPPLPFDPDYFETFATLCDVLIDVYSRVLMLVNAPNVCGPAIGEAFLKADAKIRRIVVSGTVREWEDAVRVGVKREVGGVAKEVLAGML